MSRRLISPLRISTRLTRVAARSPRVAFTRRMMSSETSHGSTSSDRTWIIGSALVFGPLFLYLVSPSARTDHHRAADHEHTKSHRDNDGNKHGQHAPLQEDVVPIADDEGTKVSGQEVKESIEKALEADSPKDAQEREEAVAKETTSTEGSATKTHSKAESATEATTVSELNSIPATPVVEDDVATQATGEDKVTAPEASAKSEA